MDGSQVMREFVPASPLVAHLGIELVALGDGEAVLRLPFRDEVVTVGRTVHGGAIATLVDTALMAASWSGAAAPDTLRGSTVDLTVHYLAPAEGADLTATATVLRRGRSLVHVAVTVVAESDRTPVASAVGTYRLG